MTRKLWRDVRPMFWMSVVILLAITGTYSWHFATTSIFEWEDASSYGLETNPGTDVPKLLREHPTGHLFSLTSTPDTYFIGFDAITRFAFQWLAVVLCAGGILTEKSGGTASFSLSLPLSRSSWLWRRAAILLGLTLGLAILDCAAAYACSVWMGTSHSVGWLLTAPFSLMFVAAPGIGISLCIQAWMSGRLHNPTLDTIMAATLAALAVAILQPSGPILWSASPVWWFIASYFKQPFLAGDPWKAFAMAVIFGMGGLLLAVHRFKRMDF